MKGLSAMQNEFREFVREVYFTPLKGKLCLIFAFQKTQELKIDVHHFEQKLWTSFLCQFLRFLPSLHLSPSCLVSCFPGPCPDLFSMPDAAAALQIDCERLKN